MRVRYVTVDVFTDRVFGGNPLAVVPDAAGLSPERMQRIARELNLSETAFVLPAETPEGTVRVRIFTPAAELPFAGHPTVGTAFALAALGLQPLDGDATRVVFEEGVGPVPVTIHARGGKPVAATLTAARLPEVAPAPRTADELASVLSLRHDDVLREPYAPEVASCGVPFVAVPVRDLDALARARVDTGRWEALLADDPAAELYVYVPPAPGEREVRARMFAPGFGIAEDPATGSACAAMGGVLAARTDARDGTLRWLVRQGVEMGRPSDLELEADLASGAVTAVRVGGRCVLVADAVMDLPD